MLRAKTLTASLAVLVLAIAGCDGEVIHEEGNDEGKSGVSGSDDEGAGGEGGGDDGADDDGAEDDGGDDGAEDDGGDDGGEVECNPANPLPPFECCPGATQSCFTDEADLEEFGDMQELCTDGGQWRQGDCDTPLVLSFDGREPILEPRMEVGTFPFDLAGQGESILSDWPRAETPWLVLDRDGDGRIADGRELFGSGTDLAAGAKARNGFEALAELDADGSGVIDAADPGFSRLALWSDHDGDRVADAGELAQVASGERRLVAIDLGYRVEARCGARGNCGVERATFRWEDAGGAHDGEVVDVHLRRR